jgi:TetR/AcrR family transcriptional regulator, cholesterol catabolism regulator
VQNAVIVDTLEWRVAGVKIQHVLYGSRAMHIFERLVESYRTIDAMSRLGLLVDRRILTADNRHRLLQAEGVLQALVLVVGRVIDYDKGSRRMKEISYMALEERVSQPELKKTDQSKTKKRARLTQRAIVSTAAELFAGWGFGATSLDDIAERLGVTKGALYYHIRNKEEILRLIYLMVLAASEEPLAHIANGDLPPDEKLHHAIVHHVAVAADRSPAMIVFYREQPHLTGPFAKEIVLRKKEYETYFQRIIMEGQAAGVFNRNVDPKIAAFGVLGMCNSLSQWYRADGPLTSAQIAAMFARMIEGGITLMR